MLPSGHFNSGVRKSEIHDIFLLRGFLQCGAANQTSSRVGIRHVEPFRQSAVGVPEFKKLESPFFRSFIFCFEIFIFCFFTNLCLSYFYPFLQNLLFSIFCPLNLFLTCIFHKFDQIVLNF